jgi:organic hydroperoxide reductase OsmC/OhrA
MPSKLPHHYATTVTRSGPSKAVIDAPPRAPIAGAPPPEFDGPPEAWSPEHLLLSSLGLCLYTTFEAFARRDHLEVDRWRATVEGTLDKTPGGLAFTAFHVAVELAVSAADIDRAQAVLERAHKACIVSNALRMPVAVDARVMATASAA